MSVKERIEELTIKITRIYVCLKSKNTPWYVKFLGWITVGYALSPIDLIPDFIPILGYIDDLVILPVLALITIKMIPKSIWEDSLEIAESIWKDGKPKKWYYAIPIVLIWLIIVFLVIFKIFY
ncbi:YkvA family protein [Candidatus Izemoplasma sp. B36]|uniref:YkvA family protein n=1 Tax=Candidatus Izemoplasma sp. B36 TaxID=3242468 RepID=UPI003558FE4E